MEGFLKDLKRQINSMLQPFSFSRPYRLMQEVERLKEKLGVEPVIPDSCDFDELIAKVLFLWKTKRESGLLELSYKEKRCLCWALYIGKDIRIVDRIDLLMSILQLFKRPGYLDILIRVYLKNFDLCEGSEVLRRFILDHLRGYNGRRNSLRNWKGRMDLLFSENAIYHTTNWILSQKDKHPEACLKELGLIGGLSDSEFVKYVVLLCLKITENNLNTLPVLLSLLESPVGFTIRFPEILPAMASGLILRADSDGSEEVQRDLRSFFLKYLGDPRLPGSRVRWGGVAKKARDVFIQWLSKEDLRFFFDVVERSAGDPNWRYRRKFWEAYLPYIKETWVILGSKARDLVKGTECSFGHLGGAGSDKSIFLIKMHNYVFLEWSHSGACRVYKESVFPWEFGQDYYHVSEIKWFDYEYRQIHSSPERYRWQDDLARWISTNLAIYPARSYHLEEV